MVDEKIVVWGAGEFGKNTVQCFIRDIIPMDILAVVDKDPQKWGQKLCGIPIISYEEMKALSYDRVLICSPKYQEDIYSFLVSTGEVPRQKIEVVRDCAYFIYKRIEEKYKYQDVELIEDLQKQKVVSYLQQHGAGMFCYEYVKKYRHNTPTVFFDETEKLNFVLHEGKRLYISAKLQGYETIRQYYNSLCMEQDKMSPHLYQTDHVKVADGDVVLDVGAAEGFFTLSVIDKASYVYMIEADEGWQKALEATFRPYSEKVKIIAGFAADINKNSKITIDGVVKNVNIDFIKMDIEGAEISALKGAVNTLSKNNVKCAICTYHNDNDFDEINSFFEDMGYQTEASNGYILCTGMWEKNNKNLDFRKGVLRSWKD